MSRSDDERVADILEAADELALVVAVGRQAFGESVLHRRAAERLLEIIGEASTALSDAFTAARPGVPWRDVGALRILLAHHYHRIDVDQVWQIAAVSVPELVRHLRPDGAGDFSSAQSYERLQVRPGRLKLRSGPRPYRAAARIGA